MNIVFYFLFVAAIIAIPFSLKALISYTSYIITYYKHNSKLLYK
ncbi:hypothetical protein [Namhaeicola litoreus]|uniref:Uncharacterized protein n=1 Tax=Namhaeicola litoreus TaxID=1052145 RepID=A0ABW3XY77_9FLAO